MKKTIVVAAAICLCIAIPAQAQEDAAGCKDYPLFTRFPNMLLVGCDSKQFDLRGFPTGPVGSNLETKAVEVEGPVYWLKYELKEGVTSPSGLQIMRNFENATTKAGGSIEGRYPGWCKANYDPERMPNMGNGCTSFALTMKFLQGAKEIWAFLQAEEGGANYLLMISEREAMKQDIGVTEIVDKLSTDGFIALYINFDTGKATIKAESAATLDTAAAALKQAAAIRVEVSGHTDNVGTPEANLKLSQDRAQAVAAALVERGVKADRLTAKGYGQTAPIADNRTEDGRAKNRRVELVKK